MLIYRPHISGTCAADSCPGDWQHDILNAKTPVVGGQELLDSGQWTVDRGQEQFAEVKYDSGSNKKLASIKKKALRELHFNCHIKICNIRSAAKPLGQALESGLKHWHAFHMPASIEVTDKLAGFSGVGVWQQVCT